MPIKEDKPDEIDAPVMALKWMLAYVAVLVAIGVAYGTLHTRVDSIESELVEHKEYHIRHDIRIEEKIDKLILSVEGIRGEQKALKQKIEYLHSKGK